MFYTGKSFRPPSGSRHANEEPILPLFMSIRCIFLPIQCYIINGLWNIISIGGATLAINRNGNNQRVGEGCKIDPFASSLARVCGTDMSLPKSRGEYYC